MFTVKDYKIVFKRMWHNERKGPDPQFGEVEDSDGRYDTKCEMYCLTETGKSFYNKPTFTGIARLHPNDKPDRVIGKKIALRNAISKGQHYNFYSKENRTVIWKAFWKWVASWSLEHRHLENRKSTIVNRKYVKDS